MCIWCCEGKPVWISLEPFVQTVGGLMAVKENLCGYHQSHLYKPFGVSWYNAKFIVNTKQVPNYLVTFLGATPTMELSD